MIDQIHSLDLYDRQVKERGDPSLPRLVSLFCGAGGLDIGFLQAGFRIGLAVDNSEAAINTHKANLLAKKSLLADIEKLGPDGIASLVEEHGLAGQAIGVIGGPPCQGFSSANNRSNSDDPRNHLIDVFSNIVRTISQISDVRFVVLENVIGLTYKKHKNALSKLLKSLERDGFYYSQLELTASNFGVPQRRKRIFITATKGLSRGLRVETISVKEPTVRDAIAGLPEPSYCTRGAVQKEPKFHPNHWTMVPKSKRFSTPVVNWKKSRSFKLLEWDKPSPTIAFGNREIHVHPSGKRRLSIFEALRLQGFPNSFVLEGNFSEQCTLVSNAVPPPLAKEIAISIREILRAE